MFDYGAIDLSLHRRAHALSSNRLLYSMVLFYDLVFIRAGLEIKVLEITFL